MQLEVGAVFEGTVTGITNFGAFVSMPDGKSGLVHISEIANTYVNNVRDHLQEGTLVKVKVIGLGEGDRVNLSIKKAEANDTPRPRPAMPRRDPPENQENKPEEQSFEDKLKQFIQDSNKKNSGNRLYSDKKGNYRKRK
jgi:S1 RNA binding domain protein